MKERTTPDSQNTPSTTNLEEEEIMDALGNEGKASMLEQVKRPNAWRKMMMKIDSQIDQIFRSDKICRTLGMSAMIVSKTFLFPVG